MPSSEVYNSVIWKQPPCKVINSKEDFFSLNWIWEIKGPLWKLASSRILYYQGITVLTEYDL